VPGRRELLPDDGVPGTGPAQLSADEVLGGLVGVAHRRQVGLGLDPQVRRLEPGRRQRVDHVGDDVGEPQVVVVHAVLLSLGPAPSHLRVGGCRAERYRLTVGLMFDTISGLPVHALVVHAVVVLLPLASILTIAVAVRPRWRHYAPVVAVIDGVVVVAAWVAKESGEKLQARLQQFDPQVAHDHGERGSLVPYVALAVFLAAVLVWATQRFPRVVPLAVVVAVLAGAGGLAWTYVTGESGARAVWGQTVANTGGPQGG
jgi:hypothetical protein